MSGQPNYEQLYHLMNKRRGEELKKLRLLSAHTAGLMTAFRETDRIVAECAETQVIPFPPTLEQRIHGFVTRIEPRSHLKRHKDACLALKILLREGEALSSMTDLYIAAAKEGKCSTARIERSLRSFRIGAAEMGTGFYQAKLAQFNLDSSSFYRNAARLLREEMETPIPFPTKE